MQAEHRLVNNREKCRDLWLDTMRVASDAANPFASPDPAALATTFASAGDACADPGRVGLWHVDCAHKARHNTYDVQPAVPHPCWLTCICIRLTGVERMAEVLRDHAPQLLRHLLPENFGAFARIFTAALLQVQPCRFAVPLDTRSPASSSRPSHLVPCIKGLNFRW